jgi:hypothetical protein
VTGAEALKIAKRAAKWAKADDERVRLLAECRLLDKAVRTSDDPAVIARRTRFRAEQRSAAARAGGLRRGLANECRRVAAKGIA